MNSPHRKVVSTSVAASTSASGARSVPSSSVWCHRSRHSTSSAAPDLARVGVAERRFAVHQPEEVVVVEEAGELEAGLLDDQLLDRRRAGGVPRLGLDPLAVHGADEVGLRREVVVEPRHGDAGRVGELPHAHRGGARAPRRGSARSRPPGHGLPCRLGTERPSAAELT